MPTTAGELVCKEEPMELSSSPVDIQPEGKLEAVPEGELKGEANPVPGDRRRCVLCLSQGDADKMVSGGCGCWPRGQRSLPM